MYDFLVVGAGLFGAVFAHEMTAHGKKCLVIDRRDHIGGNCYTERISGINVHRYGAHIFHTSDTAVWNYVNRFAEFNGFINSPLAVYKNEIYNLPFNMNTFSRLWGVRTPREAMSIISEQRSAITDREPSNLEEQALALAGRDIYEKLIKGYTEKQWGKPCRELPPEILRRVPLRFTYDNNYFDDRFQGIPVGGYTRIFEKLLEGCEVRLSTDHSEVKMKESAEHTIYTGQADELFGYCYGKLEYRSLRFETELLNCDNYQGNAVVNYTDADVPFTRIIEHKHFERSDSPNTVITREYPQPWSGSALPYYPVNNDKNNLLYRKYRKLAEKGGIILGGRLGEYRYYDMDDTVAAALNTASLFL